MPGGQASHTSMIENFFGFVEGIGGAELARLAGRQAERFGAELLILNGVVGQPARAGAAAGGDRCRAATRSPPTSLWSRPGWSGGGSSSTASSELLGHGVYYGAGRSEAVQCAGEHVMVVGAGNSAGQAVMNMASAGARVTLVVRGDSLCEVDVRVPGGARSRRASAIDVRLRSQVRELHEDGGRLEAVTIESADGGAGDACRVSGALPLHRRRPAHRSGRRGSHVRTDATGFILTGPDLLEDGRRPEDWPLDRDPLALETSIPGLFAAGDVRHGSVKRVAGAVGEGSMAVALAHHRLEELRGRGS